MRWHIECKHRGTGVEVECGFDEAIHVAQQECQCEWSCMVVWLLPDNLRMAEVNIYGILWTRSTLSGIEQIRLTRRHRSWLVAVVGKGVGVGRCRNDAS